MDQEWVGAIGHLNDATTKTCVAVMECHLTHIRETVGSYTVLARTTRECCSGWKRDEMILY